MNKLFNFCQECNVEDFDTLKDLVISKMEENYGQFDIDYVIANDNHLRTKKGDQMSFFYKCHWFVSLIIFEDEKEEIYLDEEFLKDILTRYNFLGCCYCPSDYIPLFSDFHIFF